MDDDFKCAPCRGLADLFISDGPGDHQRAKALCAGCREHQACAALALSSGATSGTWAGMTIAELHEAVAGAAERRAARRPGRHPPR